MRGLGIFEMKKIAIAGILILAFVLTYYTRDHGHGPRSDFLEKQQESVEAFQDYLKKVEEYKSRKAAYQKRIQEYNRKVQEYRSSLARYKAKVTLRRAKDEGKITMSSLAGDSGSVLTPSDEYRSEKDHELYFDSIEVGVSLEDIERQSNKYPFY